MHMLNKKLTNEEKLDLVYEMTLENHDILQSLRRQQYVSSAFRLLYWVVILGAIGGAYYYIRPAVSYLQENGTKLQTTINQLNALNSNLPEAKLINTLIEGLKKSATSGE
ncbi:MAG: hypothetical protein RI935_367 [Candidatus Parcubacteria bacterium]|jgi:hypothetical protein